MGYESEIKPLLITHYYPTKPASKFPLGLFPLGARPYLELARLDKPTGTILMFWPFAWGLTMAAFRTQLPLDEYYTCLFKSLVGAFLLRSSACTVNDILDRKMDAGVARTKDRPLPGGRVSVLSATIFLFVQYVLGIAFFWTTTHGLALFIALFQLLPLFAIYPLLKRVTHWPQAWLGVAMNFGLVTAWVMITGSLNVPLLSAAMAGCWCSYGSWTMVYDTIYACQDIKDDVKVGVRSTAILFGSWIRPLLMVCAAGFVAMFGIVGYLNHHGYPYFVVSVGGTALHLVWQFETVDLESPASCWRNFKRNGTLGWIVWGGIMFDYLSKGY